MKKVIGEDRYGWPVFESADKVETATVSMWNDPAGYGMLKLDDGRQVFAYWTQIEKDGFKTLHVGQKVSCLVVEGPKGLSAKQIKPLIDEAKKSEAQTSKKTIAGQIYAKFNDGTTFTSESGERLEDVCEEQALAQYRYGLDTVYEFADSSAIAVTGGSLPGRKKLRPEASWDIVAWVEAEKAFRSADQYGQVRDDGWIFRH